MATKRFVDFPGRGGLVWRSRDIPYPIEFKAYWMVLVIQAIPTSRRYDQERNPIPAHMTGIKLGDASAQIDAAAQI